MKIKRTPIRLIRTLIVKERERRRQRSRTGFSLVLRIVAVALLIAFITSFLAMGLGVGLAAAGYAAITEGLPTPEDVQQISEQSFETTKIYDRHGNLIYEVIDPTAGDRHWMSFAELPDYITCGTVAMEDRTFWENPGINPRGLMRAFVNNLRGLPVQGGSSITQQVVKNSVIPLEQRYEQSYTRKLEEVLISLELTRLYEKEQILEWYLNTNFYGNLAYGIDAAARVYFGKSARDLTLSEAATLIAIPQSPLLNPFDRPESALSRRDLVIETMLLEGCINQQQANQALAERWDLASSTQRFDIQAPHFSMYVRRQLEERFGPELVAGGGLQVYTTLDLALQNQTQCVAQAYLRILSGEYPDEVIAEALNAGCQAAQYL
ncbi:MAG TPA: penicillin-binding protein, partial [Chloroflexi bacterium]|nr:penicillin-binding protein [Chloroflexota bacterium]